MHTTGHFSNTPNKHLLATACLPDAGRLAFNVLSPKMLTALDHPIGSPRTLQDVKTSISNTGSYNTSRKIAPSPEGHASKPSFAKSNPHRSQRGPLLLTESLWKALGTDSMHFILGRPCQWQIQWCFGGCGFGQRDLDTVIRYLQHLWDDCLQSKLGWRCLADIPQAQRWIALSQREPCNLATLSGLRCLCCTAAESLYPAGISRHGSRPTAGHPSGLHML